MTDGDAVVDGEPDDEGDALWLLETDSDGVCVPEGELDNEGDWACDRERLIDREGVRVGGGVRLAEAVRDCDKLWEAACVFDTLSDADSDGEELALDDRLRDDDTENKEPVTDAVWDGDRVEDGESLGVVVALRLRC